VFWGNSRHYIRDTNYAQIMSSTWCEEGHQTERKEFKGDTQKYYKIHAINSDKAIDLYTFSG